MAMLDDIRTHEASPSAEELAWLSTDPVIVAFRVAALAVIALSIGILASDRGELPLASTQTASTHAAQESRP
jgi:hypothetical protein